MKILYEAVVSNRFLTRDAIDNITETIFNQTSPSKHDQADSICHRLPLDYYTKSTQFKDNLRQLIDLHLQSHSVRFDYVHSTVNRGEYVKDTDSKKEVLPIDIAVRDGYFYLLGESEKDIRPYRIDRMRNLEDNGKVRSISTVKANYEKSQFYKNNTNNFSGGDDVKVEVKWDFDIMSYYTPLFDVFGYENISQGSAEDLFIIRTRDNYGLYLNLLRLGPVIQVINPVKVREQYNDMVRQMYGKLCT